jgi:cell division protease FtsH
MGALGYTMQMPEEEEKYLMSKDEILDQITVFLAGRAAEELIFNIKTTGASNDIERATSLARNMITQYGMSDKFGMAGLESVQNKYLDGRNVSNCSEETKTMVDKEVVKVLKDCYEKAMNLLKDNLTALHEIAEFLIDKETITGDQFMEIFNKVNAEKEAEATAETEVNAEISVENEAEIKAETETEIKTEIEGEIENGTKSTT